MAHLTLYLKTHNKTGLKYLGKTTRDPYIYKGSGKRWLSHLKTHGDDVATKILFQTNNKEEFAQVGLKYSNMWNIVESDSFANLKPENGDGGSAAGRRLTEEHKANLSKAHMGKRGTWTGKKHSKESIEKMSLNHPRARPVMVSGILYRSIAECARKHNCTPPTIRHKVNSDRYPGWYYKIDREGI